MKRPISQMDRQTFLLQFGDVFEHSPWIAEEVWNHGLGAERDSATGLLAAFAQVIQSASKDQQLALLNAHPDLAVATAERTQLTRASQAEQKSAGLDSCTASEFTEFQDLNRRYRSKFGFPFIMAVRGFDRHRILEQFRSRSAGDKETEFNTAVDQVIRIGGIRIAAHFKEPE